MNLTIRQAIEEHRKMWNWIADRIEETGCVRMPANYFCQLPHDIDEWKKFPLNASYLCEYIRTFQCQKCPLQWGPLDTLEFRKTFPEACYCSVGCNKSSPRRLFYALCGGKDQLTENEKTKAVELAKEIANLKEFKNVV